VSSTADRDEDGEASFAGPIIQIKHRRTGAALLRYRHTLQMVTGRSVLSSRMVVTQFRQPTDAPSLQRPFTGQGGPAPKEAREPVEGRRMTVLECAPASLVALKPVQRPGSWAKPTIFRTEPKQDCWIPATSCSFPHQRRDLPTFGNDSVSILGVRLRFRWKSRPELLYSFRSWRLLRAPRLPPKRRLIEAYAKVGRSSWRAAARRG
jgi:hypothetical protein